MAIAIVEELWARIRAAIDDKIVAAEDAAASAEADRVVVEQAAMSASWSGDRLTVLGATSPPLMGPQGPEGPKGDSGDGAGDVLWSELNPVLDAKADIGAIPTTDGGYGIHHASDPAADYPWGVSYGMHYATSAGSWNAVIQADTGYINSGTFVMVQTLRQSGFTKSTTQLVFSYDDEHKPVFMRKWYGEAWGPFRSLTDDGHQHAASQISDATATGRSVLTAATAAAARTAIGAGTSSLALGTTSSTAARGNHTHSEYAEASRVTALEGSQPIIVSSLPSSPLPGRIYLVTG